MMPVIAIVAGVTPHADGDDVDLCADALRLMVEQNATARAPNENVGSLIWIP